MDRQKLHSLFKRNRGAIAKLAADLGIHSQTLSGWFMGNHNSARIEAAVYERAEELLAHETQAGLVWAKRQQVLSSITA